MRTQEHVPGPEDGQDPMTWTDPHGVTHAVSKLTYSVLNEPHEYKIVTCKSEAGRPFVTAVTTCDDGIVDCMACLASGRHE